MVDDFQDQEIIKIADVDKKEYKKLGEDKLFKFECTVEGQQLRLGLKEINCYSPYYYEVFYTLEELYNMKDFFRAKTGLEEIQSNLIALFSRKTTRLESLENDSKIKLHIEAVVLADDVEMDFILERKTVNNMDEALYFLYKLEKNKYNILEKIKTVCKNKNEKTEKIAKEILEILKKFDNYYN